MGGIARPPIDSSESSLRELPSQLIRCLDEQGVGRGEWLPKVEPDRLRLALRAMLLTLVFDNRLFRIQRQ